jgi:lysophospholipase L1-like esterase
MIYTYGVIAAILLYAAFVVLRIQFRPEIAEIVQPRVVLGKGAELTYIAAGDSTAVGEGATKVENTYAYQILTKLSETNQVKYKNIGVGGAQTTDVVEKQMPQIIAADPDIVTISIGANDLTHLVSSNKIIENYKTIIKDLTEQTHARVYLTDIPVLKNTKLLPWWYRKIIDRKANQLNKEIRGLETDRVKIVDIYNFGWDRYTNIQDTFAQDHFHPSDLGYQNWRDAFLDKMLKKD